MVVSDVGDVGDVLVNVGGGLVADGSPEGAFSCHGEGGLGVVVEDSEGDEGGVNARVAVEIVRIPVMEHADRPGGVRIGVESLPS